MKVVTSNTLFYSILQEITERHCTAGGKWIRLHLPELLPEQREKDLEMRHACQLHGQGVDH